MKIKWDKIKWFINYIISIFMYAIIGILLLVGIIVLLYYIDIKKRESADVWKPPLYGAYVIVSQSMEPIIKVNDAIIIKRDKNIKVGDVITYKSLDPTHYNIMITHRVISIINNTDGTISYVTKGDNNNIADKLSVNGDTVYGKVIMKIPKIGYIQYFLMTKLGWIIAIVIPCLGIVIYDIIKLFKNITKKKKKVLVIDE